MSNVNICLICLSDGVKMYNYNKYNLKMYYEEMMMAKAIDVLPHYICYLCGALLCKFHKFKERCQAGQQILKEILSKGPITLDAISQVDHSSEHLKSALDILTISKRVKTYSIEDKSIHYINIEESLDDATDYDTDNSYTNENSESSMGIYEKITNIDEGKVNVDVLKINDDKEKINDKQTANTNEKDTSNLSNDGQTQVLNFAIQIKQYIESATLEHEAVYLTENVMNDKDRGKDNVKVKRSQKRKSKDTATETAKRKIKTKYSKDAFRKEKASNVTSRGKRKQFNPEHWLIVTLTEEEAKCKFEERATNPKYIEACYKCEECFTPFSREDILNRHKNTVHCESRGSFICHFCRRRFKVASDLKKHKLVHYEIFNCLRCPLVISHEDSASRHDDYHNGAVEVCKHCGMQFKHRTTYYSHVRVYHRSEHVCTHCGESFVSALGLTQHKKNKHRNTDTVNKEDEGGYCERCDIKFETILAYEEHFHESIKHADTMPKLKPNGSDEDTEGEDSMTLSALLTLKGKITNPNPHIYNTNKSRGTKTCDICGKLCQSRFSYNKHHREAHKGIPKPVDSTLICEICGVTIKSNNISHHMNIHTRSRMYPCPTCGKHFTMKTNMLRHNLTHLKRDRSEYEFKCPLCEKRFTQKGSMQLHYRTKHLKEPYPKRNRKKKTAVHTPEFFGDSGKEIKQ